MVYSAAMRIGTTGFVRDDHGRILLIQRDDTRTYAMPGGALDLDELPPDGVVREIREETGLETAVDRLLGFDFWQPAGSDGFLSLIFACTPVGGRMQTSNESLNVGFYAPDNLPSPIASVHQSRIRRSIAQPVGAPPFWGRTSVPLVMQITYQVLTRLVYRWRDWQRLRRGEPAFVPPPTWDSGAFVVIRDDNGRVLWVKRTDKDLWNLPGGGGIAGEAPWETAVRETREETGLHVRLLQPTGIYLVEHLPHLVVAFLAEPVGGSLTTGPEAAAFDWFTPGSEPQNTMHAHLDRVRDALSAGEPVFRMQAL